MQQTNRSRYVALLYPLLRLATQTAAQGDYTTPTGDLAHYQTRLSEKREKLRQEQEQLLAEQDRLYNQTHAAEPPATWFQEYGWTVVLGILPLAVIVRIALDQRYRRSLRRTSDAEGDLPADSPEAGGNSLF